MKRIFLILFFLGVSDAQPGIAFRGITEDLRKVMENPEIRSGSEEPLIPVNIILKEKADFEELYRVTQGVPKRIRRAVVWEEIQRVANESQASLRVYLREKEGEGKVKDMKILWTANGINAQVEKSIIEEIWNRFPEIRSMDWDEIRPLEEVMDYRIRPETSSGSEFGIRNSIPLSPFNKGGIEGGFYNPPPDTAWGVIKINAPQVWAMGYTGTGIILGNIDTGTNYNHVDLADHLWDGDTTYPNHGWDFFSNDN
ncbi:hypothetical protein IIA15_08575, partial [candidate division TA06 bacterium]|nr:hypothetical protein [candidate division TA06 bacterium]